MIVLVNYSYGDDVPDGETVLVRHHAQTEWARALARAGDQPVAVVQRFRADRVMHVDGVAYHLVGDGGDAAAPQWFLGAKVARAVAALRPSVAHINGLVFPVAGRHLRRRLPRATPVLVQDHGGIRADHPGFRRRAWRWLYRYGFRALDGFLFTARELAEPWWRAGIVARRQLVYEVVEASSDLHRGEAAEDDAARDKGLDDRDGENRERRGGSSGDARHLPGRPALLWVGRLNANKDPLTILDGFARALPSLPDAALTMVFGEDDLLPEVRRRIDQSPTLRARVRLAGRLPRARLPALYRAADLFVLGSHDEGSGYALIEALGFGVMPVVSDIPAFRVLTDGGRVGALFPVGDAAALARALAACGPRAGASARQAVRAHFEASLSWPAIAARALAVYRQARLHAARNPGKFDL